MNYTFSLLDHQLSQWPLLFVIAAGIFLYQKTDRLFWFCCMSVFTVGAYNLSIDRMDVINSIRFKKEILFGILSFVSSLFFYLYPIKKIWIDTVFIFNLIFTIGSFAFGSEVRGLGVNTSVNATCLAIMFFIWQADKKINPFLAIVTLISVCIDKTSMGLIAFLCGIVAFFPKILPLAGIVFLAAFSIYGDSLFWLSGRDSIWELAYNFYFDRGLFFGTGWGSFAFIGPMMQIGTKSLENGYFISLHSDILQAMLELGAIGIIPWVIFFLRETIFATPWKRAFFFAVIISMAGNFPLRVPLSSALIFWGFSYFRKKSRGDHDRRTETINF